MVRVPSWANSVVVIGVRIHALLAGEAKANALAVFGEIARRTRAQAQQRSGQQVGDFLMRVAWVVSWWENAKWFAFRHGRRSDGKRCSC
jgi:hypothetical protein